MVGKSQPSGCLGFAFAIHHVNRDRSRKSGDEEGKTTMKSNRSSFDKIAQNPNGSFGKNWSQGTILDYNLSLLAGDLRFPCPYHSIFNQLEPKTRLGLPGLALGVFGLWCFPVDSRPMVWW